MSLTGRGTWGEPADPAAARALLRRAADLGVQLFDTADSYGPEVAESLVREALHPYDGLLIATKGGFRRHGPHEWEADCRPESLRAACEASLARLGVERIDLYQLHLVDARVPVEESVGALGELREEGKIREIGVCNVGVAHLERARRVTAVVSVQNRFSLAERSSTSVLARCTEDGLAFIAWAPLAKGFLSRASGALASVAPRARRDARAGRARLGDPARRDPHPRHGLGRPPGGERRRARCRADGRGGRLARAGLAPRLSREAPRAQGARTRGPPQGRRQEDRPVSGTRVTVARTIEAVEELRDTWEALLPERLTADLDYHLTVLRYGRGVIRPHVAVLERDGSPTALAVGRVEEAELTARIGYKAVLRPRVRALTIAQGGLLGIDGETAEPLFAALSGALAEDGLHVLRLRLLEVGGPVHGLARTRPGLLVRQHLGAQVERWRARIPATFDEYLGARSSKTRSNVKRYGRRLEERYGEGVEFKVFRRPAELEELMRDTAAVHVKTYQHGMGAGLTGGELERRLRELAAERGWFRGFVLYLDGMPAAFWHGTAYRRVFYTGPTGYDPAHRDLRLGTYVLVKMVEQLCGEVDWMDFGSGDAEYKRRFSDDSRLEEDVTVFAARPRPIAINLAQTTVRGSSQASKALLSRSGRLRAARRAWRGRLVGNAPGALT